MKHDNQHTNVCLLLRFFIIEKFPNIQKMEPFGSFRGGKRAKIKYPLINYMLVPSLLGHYSYHHYYELVRLLINHLSNLVYKTSLWHTYYHWYFKLQCLKNLWDLPGILNISMIYSPCSIDPGGTLTISCITISPLLSAVERNTSTTTIYI